MGSKIMVISDTHEDAIATKWVLDYLEENDINKIIHLGDYYSDALIIEEHGYELIKVPGTWDHLYYQNPSVNNRKFVDIAGWKLFLSHTPESHYNDLPDDLKPETIIFTGKADIFLYGHTHLAEVKHKNGMIFVNPGHMSNDEERGCPLTYAILEIDEEWLTVSIKRLFHDKTYIKKHFQKSLLKDVVAS
jgi:hypothetical protein